MDSEVDGSPNGVSSSAPSGLVRMLLAVSLPLFGLDQATKYWVWRNLAGHESVEVIRGWFELVYVTNTGAAWGVMHNNNGFLAFLALFAFGVLAVMYRQRAFERGWPRAGFFLLIPGIVGNLMDRLAHGHVIDFLSFDLHVPGASPWPSFNVADSCICVAVGLFLIGSFQETRVKTLKG